MKRTLMLVGILVLVTLPVLLIALALGTKSVLGGFLFALYFGLLLGGGALLIFVVLPALRWLDKVRAKGPWAVIALLVGVGVVLGGVLALVFHAKSENLPWIFAFSIGLPLAGAALYRRFARALRLP